LDEHYRNKDAEDVVCFQFVKALPLRDYRGLAMNEYIREGERSFHECGGRYRNPYEIGSAKFNDFERGFFQALKRSPGRSTRNHRFQRKAPRQQRVVLPAFTPMKKRNEMSDAVYVLLERRAREKLLRGPSYQAPRYGWLTKVYYARIETCERPLWKIGITSNDLDTRYRTGERRLMVEIKSWPYATREEAEAIEREVLAEFADDVYKGGPVLQSGGDSELFTRDVLKMDSQDDFLAMTRKDKQADASAFEDGA
jgi:hypothetical protein